MAGSYFIWEKDFGNPGMQYKKDGSSNLPFGKQFQTCRGTCIIQSVYPISCSDWSEEQENHCVDLSYKELKERYKNPHAWVLADVEPVEDVWYYDHPNGAVIWVKDVSPVDEMQDERLRYGY